MLAFMHMHDDADERLYDVVINDEEQYSVWWLDRDPPAGWRKLGMPGTKAACLARIKDLWVDLRPKSVRSSTRA